MSCGEGRDVRARETRNEASVKGTSGPLKRRRRPELLHSAHRLFLAAGEFYFVVSSPLCRPLSPRNCPQYRELLKSIHPFPSLLCLSLSLNSSTVNCGAAECSSACSHGHFLVLSSTYTTHTLDMLLEQLLHCTTHCRTLYSRSAVLCPHSSQEWTHFKGQINGWPQRGHPNGTYSGKQLFCHTLTYDHLGVFV